MHSVSVSLPLRRYLILGLFAIWYYERFRTQMLITCTILICAHEFDFIFFFAFRWWAHKNLRFLWANKLAQPNISELANLILWNVDNDHFFNSWNITVKFQYSWPLVYCFKLLNSLGFCNNILQLSIFKRELHQHIKKRERERKHEVFLLAWPNGRLYE